MLSQTVRARTNVAAFSPIHSNEDGKVVWFADDHAATSSTVNSAFDRRLIHKPRVIPHGASNQSKQNAASHVGKTAHAAISSFHFHNVRETIAKSLFRCPVQRQPLLDATMAHPVKGWQFNANSQKTANNLLHRSRGPRGYCIGTSFAAAR